MTLLQCAEGLSDRQAADAVRSRIDWKYVLRLELTDAGFDASVLSAFRSRLIAGAAEYLLFETLLTWCRNRQLIKTRGRQRTDSTHILAAVRALNRIEVVGETLRHTLNTLAVVAPEWLRAVSPPEWGNRYTRRAEDDRLPTTQTARATLTLTIGNDGRRLLSAVDHADAPPWLREVPAVAILRRVCSVRESCPRIWASYLAKCWFMRQQQISVLLHMGVAEAPVCNCIRGGSKPGLDRDRKGATPVRRPRRFRWALRVVGRSCAQMRGVAA